MPGTKKKKAKKTLSAKQLEAKVARLEEQLRRLSPPGDTVKASAAEDQAPYIRAMESGYPVPGPYNFNPSAVGRGEEMGPPPIDVGALHREEMNLPQPPPGWTPESSGVKMAPSMGPQAGLQGVSRSVADPMGDMGDIYQKYAEGKFAPEITTDYSGDAAAGDLSAQSAPAWNQAIEGPAMMNNLASGKRVIQRLNEPTLAARQAYHQMMMQKYAEQARRHMEGAESGTPIDEV